MLLHTVTFHGKGGSVNRGTGLQIASVIVDTLSDALRGKVRVSPATLVAMLTVSTTTRYCSERATDGPLQGVRDVLRIGEDYLPSGSFLRISTDSSLYLCVPSRNSAYVNAHFAATMLAADMVHAATQQDVTFLHEQFASANEVSLECTVSSDYSNICVARWKGISSYTSLECSCPVSVHVVNRRDASGRLPPQQPQELQLNLRYFLTCRLITRRTIG